MYGHWSRGLQIVSRDQHSTKLQWLDPKDDVAGRFDTQDATKSPFVGHSGLSVCAAAVASSSTGGSDSIVSYSPDGRLLARVRNCDAKEEPSGAEVSVIDTASGRQVLSIRGQSPADIVQGVTFSPQGSYLVICSRYCPASADTQPPSLWTVACEGRCAETPVATNSDGTANKNLAIWHVPSGALSGAWSTNQHWDPDKWPYVQWRNDEMQAAFAVPGALVMLRANEHPTAGFSSLTVEARMALASREPCTFALAPSCGEVPPKVAVFIQGPAALRVDVVEFTAAPSEGAGVRGEDAAGGQEEVNGEEAGKAWETVASMPLQGGEDVSLKWSLDAGSLLVLSTTHVDDANEHYYGTTSLQLMFRRNGKKSGCAGDGGGGGGGGGGRGGGGGGGGGRQRWRE